MGIIRRFAVLICLIMVSLHGVAQATSLTENISYQAVIRNSMNEPIRNTYVGVQVSVLMNNSESTPVYEEVHNVMTNEGGVLSLAIGAGSPIEGSQWSAIEWGGSAYLIKVEIDPEGGNNYTLTSVTSLMSVPYAKYANKAGALSRPLSYDQIEGRPQGSKSGDMLFWDASQRMWQVLEVGMEGQFLCIADGRPTWIEPSFANTSAGSYKIGDVYYSSDGKAEGVVFEVSLTGRYGKIVSLTEIVDKTWDPKGTQEVFDAGIEANYPKVTGATNVSDGEENTNLVRTLNGYATTNPAFELAGLGAEWYVPSINEMKTLYDARNSINEAVATVSGGVLMDQSIYWSSTEKTDFIALAMIFKNTNLVVGEMVIPLYAGDTYDAMKGEVQAVRAVRKLSWNEVTNKPIDAKLYKVGDIIYSETTPVGVVYETSDGGLHGKILSLQESSAAWATEDVVVGAADVDDGSKNITKVVTDKIDAYPAFKWVRSLGADWYIPSLNEMIAIGDKLALINGFLPPANAITLSDYWTSTEVDQSNVYKVTISSPISSEGVAKATAVKVRAIRKF